MTACTEGILGTGDGTADHPYLVVRVSDEYDILRHLKKRSTSQGLRRKDDKSCDVMTCADGSQIWFDVSAPFNRLMRRLGDK
jgi:hypothetical protein